MNKKIELLLKQILELDDLSGVRLHKLENCKYLVILDMGCGSTSAAVLNLEKVRKGDAVGNCFEAVKWYYRGLGPTGREFPATDQLFIPTLIGYSGFNPFIGTVALKTENACENFKAIPTNENLGKIELYNTAPNGKEPRTLANIWSDYFRCIADKICSWCAKTPGRGPANRLNMAEDTLVMVAHPAGGEWSSPAVLKNFRTLIADGMELPNENILTISEAKAAMQYVRRKRERQIDFGAGVVVIDIGASTIDIEFLAKDLPEPIEYSLTMAGRDVDKLLLHYGLESLYPVTMQNCLRPDQLPNEDFFLDHFSAKFAVVKYNARIVKEFVSENAANKARQGYSYVLGSGAVMVTADTLKRLLGDQKNDPLTGAVFGSRSFPTAYPADIAKYIHELKGSQPDVFAAQQVEDTWYGHLENMVRYVMDTLAGEGHRVGNIIVTGGSCLLPGIKEHIWDAVQNSEMGSVFSDIRNIECMNHPDDYENAVPYGGGYYVGGVLAKLDLLQKFPEELYASLYGELLAAAQEEIADEVNSLLREITLESLEWWRSLSNGDKDCSVSKLHKHIQDERARICNETDRLEKAVAAAIGKLTPEASLPQTMKEVNILMDTLAGTKFSGQIRVNTFKLNLPAASIADAVKRVDLGTLKLKWWAAIMGKAEECLNSFPHILGKDKVGENDILHRKFYREGKYNAYKSQAEDGVDRELLEAISVQLRQEFQKTNIFGIPDQIIGALERDIIHALYLN